MPGVSHARRVHNAMRLNHSSDARQMAADAFRQRHVDLLLRKALAQTAQTAQTKQDGQDGQDGRAQTA